MVVPGELKFVYDTIFIVYQETRVFLNKLFHFSGWAQGRSHESGFSECCFKC